MSLSSGSQLGTRYAALHKRVVRELNGFGGISLRARFFLMLAGALPDFRLVGLRTQYYRLAGFSIGPKASLLGRMRLIGDGDLTQRLIVGEGAIIAPGVTISLDAMVTLGKNTSLGPGVTLYTATHGIGFGSRRMAFAVTARPITVEDGAWVGLQALVLPGVTLGHGCVVSAGAVVGESVAPNEFVGGNPAVVIRSLPFGDR